MAILLRLIEKAEPNATKVPAGDWQACVGKLLGIMHVPTVERLNELSPKQLADLVVPLAAAIEGSARLIDTTVRKHYGWREPGPHVWHDDIGDWRWDEQNVKLVTFDAWEMEGVLDRPQSERFRHRLDLATPDGYAPANIAVANFLLKNEQYWPTKWDGIMYFAGTAYEEANGKLLIPSLHEGTDRCLHPRIAAARTGARVTVVFVKK